MSADPTIGQDEGTQRMVQDAQHNFPDRTLDDAVQQQANLGPGREAAKHEGTGVMESVKDAAASAVESVKQKLPATRDMKEPHC